MPSHLAERPAAVEFAPYYANYIVRVPQGDLLEHLRSQVAVVDAILRPLDQARAGSTYAPGKWTVREVLGHLIDTERVFGYRAIAFARGDANPLPSFDQAAWNPAGRFDERAMGDLVDEWIAQRSATIALVHGLPVEALDRRGIASGASFSVRALLHIPPGHVSYHLAHLREHYRIG